MINAAAQMFLSRKLKEKAACLQVTAHAKKWRELTIFEYLESCFCNCAEQIQPKPNIRCHQDFFFPNDEIWKSIAQI